MLSRCLLTKNLIKLFSQQIKQLGQKQYLSLASKKLHQLADIAEQHEDQGMDINSTETILRINHNQHSIVINTQTPNRQLWYSCTKSGPQRFDYVIKDDGLQIWRNSKGQELSQRMKKDIQAILMV